MRMWQVAILVNLALAVGLGFGYGAWGSPAGHTRRRGHDVASEGGAAQARA